VIVRESPLSLLQEEMWRAEQTTTSPRENVYAALRLTGVLDARALEAALCAVVDRHEMLRARIVTDGGLRQIIETLIPRLPSEPVGSLDEALKIAAAEAAKRFDLAELPLWRIRLLQLDTHDHVLSLVFHHIVSDGWSLYVFLHELSSAYSQAMRGEQLTFEHLPRTYVEHCRAERQTVTGEALARQVSHWQRSLPLEIPLLELPSDFARPLTSASHGDTVEVAFPERLVAGLKSRAREHHTTFFATVLAGFAIVLARQARAHNVIIGVPTANRTSRDIQPEIGYFANMLPVVLQVADDATFGEMVDVARQAMVKALTYPDLPPELLMRQMDKGEGLPYRVCLNMHSAPPLSYSFSGLDVTGLPVSNGTTNFDYELFFAPSGDSAKGYLMYDVDLFTLERATTFWSRLGRLLASGVEHPDLPVNELVEDVL
jgi:Condensation domain